MMVKQKKLLLRCSDDSVIVMAFVLDDGAVVRRQGTPAEIEAEIRKASAMWPPERLPILSWEEITVDDLPTDRTYRNAWVTKGGRKIEHNMVKARNIHRDLLRFARAPILNDLDVEYIRADELGDTQKKAEIAKRKQELRDITQHPDIEKAQTIEELKKVWL